MIALIYLFIFTPLFKCKIIHSRCGKCAKCQIFGTIATSNTKMKLYNKMCKISKIIQDDYSTVANLQRYRQMLQKFYCFIFLFSLFSLHFFFSLLSHPLVPSLFSLYRFLLSSTSLPFTLACHFPATINVASGHRSETKSGLRLSSHSPWLIKNTSTTVRSSSITLDKKLLEKTPSGSDGRGGGGAWSTTLDLTHALATLNHAQSCRSHPEAAVDLTLFPLLSVRLSLCLSSCGFFFFFWLQFGLIWWWWWAVGYGRW